MNMDKQIYNFFLEKNKGFVKKNNYSQELKIINLIISQKESEICIAKIDIPFEQKDKLLNDHDFLIVYDDEVLFRGALLNIPFQKKEGILEVEFLAIYENTFLKVKNIISDLKKQNPFYNLFFDQNQNDSANVLESENNIFAFSRFDDGVYLSDVFRGSKKIVLHESQIIGKSFKTFVRGFPLSKVKVELVADWIQKGQGEFDLMPFIAKKFKNGFVNTLTPQQLLSSFPKQSDFIKNDGRKKTGYQIIFNDIHYFDPNALCNSNFYPKVTPYFLDSKDGNFEDKKRFRRYWLNGKLIVGWDYKQPRKEVVKFFCDNKFNNHFQREKKLVFHLNNPLINIDVPNYSSSFFDKEIGLKVIEFSKKIAKSHLYGSFRNLEINLKTTWDIGCKIDLDTSIELPFLDSKKNIEGKVCSYKMIACGRKSFVIIKILVSCFNESPNEFEVVNQKTFFDNNSDKDFYNVIEKKEEIFAEKIDGISELEKIVPQDLIKDIRVINSGDDQIEFLQKLPKEQFSQLKQIVAGMPTTIEIDLQDMGGKLMTRTIIL
jgi:hypothetical protein